MNMPAIRQYWHIGIFVLSACSCAQPPIAPDSTKQLEEVAAVYAVVNAFEHAHCPAQPACGDVRRAGYRAEAAYETAWGERTQPTIVAAQSAVTLYAKAVDELRP
jgi:hypothetical protein